MILVVAAESPWPGHNGGRRRTAGLVEALGTVDDVQVAVARGRRGGELPARVLPLPTCTRSRAAALLGAGPRLGRGLLDDGAARELRRLAAGARAVVLSHSYLAPALPDLPAPVVVDLQNLEVHRQRSSGTLLGRLESAKARRWEPRAARAALACVCVDEQDAATVRGWGAPRVVVVPSVEPVPLSPPSPADGTVLAVADWLYEPNAVSARELLSAVWPQVLERRPGARLVLAGRGSEPLGGLGFVDDLDPLYDAAAVVVAPARTGGGTQLKVASALARGRTVVTTPHGERSLPAEARPACWSGDLVEGLLAAVSDVDERHRREQLLRALPRPDWVVSARPLLELLGG